MECQPGLDKGGSESHINETEERSAEHIGSNVLLVEGCSEGGEKTRRSARKGLQYLAEQRSELNIKLM